MGINVQLRSEQGDIIVEVNDPKMVLARAAGNALSGTRLLRYLVPWGDAVFNQAQAADLAEDIRAVKSSKPGTPLCDLLSEIEHLVEKLSHETRLYLWFGQTVAHQRQPPAKSIKPWLKEFGGCPC
jgi:hypothetical protein